MKKYLILLFILVTTVCYAQSFEKSEISAVKTADALIVTGSVVFDGLIAVLDGTNNVTFNIYDNTAASGTRLAPTDMVALGTSRVFAFSYNPPVLCENGIYVDITTSGTVNYQVLYRIAPTP